MASILVYGAYGYTGELVAREAVARGLAPILAGRRAEPLARLASELGVEHRVFGLADPFAVDRGLRGVDVVLHCAGPFVRTAAPMAEGCLRARAHYLDITGELPVFAALERMGAAARDAGILLMPGAGFDVVPTDCLAADVARRLPGADRIRLGLAGFSRPSRGTARTAIDGIARGWGRVASGAPRNRRIDFGRGPTPCAAVSWGDLFTTPRTTGVKDVAVYMPSPAALRILGPFLGLAAPLLRLGPVRELLIAAATRGLPGPTEAELRRSAVQWCEATDPSGARVEARQKTPEPYRLTALVLVEIAARVAGGDAPPGYRTPAGAYGPDLVLAIPGCTRTDVA